MRDQVLSRAKRLVIKIGSSLVASRDIGLQPERLEHLAEDLSALQHEGCQVVVVTSGAIVSGIKKLGLKSHHNNLPIKQAAAAIGQSRLMWGYEKAFERLGQTVAQVLLTHQELADRKVFLNARHTLTTLIAFGVIPIVNENDTVAVDEIRFGDNDTLAGQVAHLIDADLLIILSDVDGLFTEDPRTNPSATLIPLVTKITPDIEQCAGSARTGEGTGGMATKVTAAKKAAEYGVPTLILNGEIPGLLAKVRQGEQAGTVFLPRDRRLGSRKRWIAFTLRSRGQLVLDTGAVEAVTHRGKSLLPSGILAVKGRFDSGDAVACTDPDGKEFAQGLANFSSNTLQRIKGLKTHEIQTMIGEQEYDEVIHRDNLVIL